MTAFVLDNSVTMRWCFEAGIHPHADAILASLAAPGTSAVMPVLWPYEVTSVLARAQLAGTLAAIKTAEFFTLLKSLPITVDAESSQRIFSDVYRLAVTYRLTSYDAAYLELALRRNLPLATLDNELIVACGKAGVAVL